MEGVLVVGEAAEATNELATRPGAEPAFAPIKPPRRREVVITVAR